MSSDYAYSSAVSLAHQNSFLILLFLVLMISSVSKTFSESAHFIRTDCQGKSLYSSGSVFEANLNETLFTLLLPKAGTVHFYNDSAGLGEDQVYGLFYCKGDVDAQTCRACVDDARKKIKDGCKFSKEGIIWYEECTLRYANRSFFSIAEYRPLFQYANTSGKVNAALLDPHKDIFCTTMKDLIQEAPNIKGNIPCFFTKRFNFSSSQVIQGLAQCTPDIAGPKCYNCLTTALKQLDLWGYTIVFLPNCFLRFDYYIIGSVLDSAPVRSLNQPLLKVPYIALMVVLPVVFIVLAVIFGPRIWKRCSACSLGHKSSVAQPLTPERARGLPRYTYAEVEQMTNKLEKQLGSGGFGVVYHGCLLDGSNREVAVKLLKENDAPNQFSNEINVFVNISHNNLVSLLGYCQEGTKLALIYEYMDKGDLKMLLKENGDCLSWTYRLKIAIDTAEGLHYLHKKCVVRIVHRDVKPANILLNKNLHAKVADFGLSKIFTDQDATTIETRVIGTFGYKAPEYSATGMLNDKADVYSFGVVLMELITGRTPSIGCDLVGWFVKEINTGSIEEALDPRLTNTTEQTKQLPNSGSVWGAAELAKACVETKETDRPDMSDVISKLNECYKMEVENKAGTSQTGSPLTVIMSPVFSGSLTTGPEPR